MLRGTLLGIALVVGGVGCGSVDSDVDPTGSYTVAVTNGANGCEFMDWQQGNSSMNIPLIVSVDGDTVVAEIGGLIGQFIELTIGSRTFIGSISGSHLSLSLIGDKDLMQGDCTYRVRAFVEADLDGDVMLGTIEYSRDVEPDQTCADLDGCRTAQSFNGTRPPTQ